MARRVVVTGMGALAPNGNSVSEMWENTKNGVSGITALTKATAEDLPVHFAGQLQNLDLLNYLDKKEIRRYDEYCQYGVIAGDMAMADAAFGNQMPNVERFGTLIGSGIGGLKTSQTEITKMNEKGWRRVNPLLVPMMISNMASGNLALKHGLKGYSTSIVTACASGTHAIGDAYRLIKHGYMDAMLAGGAEAPIVMLSIAGFLGLQALSKSEDINRASIPFDADRNGFVIGEGAGILVLEEYEHAKARGAKIYAEISGYGATSDAYHMTAPDPEGDGCARAMRLAMEEAGVQPDDVGYINAHGTSTELNDKTETLAIKKALGEEAAYKTPVSSTKSMTGHLLGAAGGIEAIFSILAMRDSFLPPTINYQVADADCDLDIVPNQGRSAQISVAMSNSLGFGGHNGTLLFTAI